MENYTANDIQNFISSNGDKITHLIVAHTHFRPCNKNKKQIELMTVQAKKNLRHALNCFSKLLYSKPNRPVQNPQLFRPLSLVTIEGANPTTNNQLSIHFNISLGNLPSVLTTEDIGTLFRHAWCNKAKQSANVWVSETEKGTARRWTGYTLKEAQQAPYKAWYENGIWDVENSWIPYAAFSKD